MKFELSYLQEYLQVLKTASIAMDIRYKHSLKMINDNAVDRDDIYVAVTSLTGGLATTLKGLDGVIFGMENVIKIMKEDKEE